MRPFIDHYGTETVTNDLKRVLQLESTFTREIDPYAAEQKELATVFENLFIQAAAREHWLGSAEIMRATKYDDYINGIDIMSTLYDREDQASHLAVSADLTFGTEASNTKLEKILHEIDRGKLARVKYYHSEQMGFTGALRDVPRTVIGLDRTNLPEFIREQVHNHPTDTRYRDEILTQLVLQLKYFRDYADRRHGEHPIRRKYAMAEKTVGQIIAHHGITDSNNRVNDEITNNIKDMMRV